MDLELTDDQLTLRDNIRSVLDSACPPSLVRSVYEGTGDAKALWDTMVELGWPALGVPEEAGGIGLGAVEVGLLAEELGRASAPGPLLATVTQFVPVLTELGAHDVLTDVAAGTISGSLALTDTQAWGTAGVTSVARRTGDAWTVSGTKPAVLGGATVDTFAVVARPEGGHGLGVFLVDRANATVTPRVSLDAGLDLADLHLEAAPARAIADRDADAALARAIQQAEVAMALHTVGACRRIFEVTLDYAKVRVQYDQLIGSFQALKHRFAEMYLAVERANAVGYFAAVAIAEDDPRRAEAAHLAKATAGDCQRLIAEDGLQLHGGIGYTWEHDLHFLLKRAKAGELLCGTSAAHRAALAVMLGLATEVAA